MLKIQLCPESELENRQWWVSDAVVAVLAITVSYFSATSALNAIKDETLRLNAVKLNWTKQYDEIAPSLGKFKNLDAEILLLNAKLASLKRITVSKIDKVLPIVVMEQIQTLTPQGVWVHSAKFHEDRSISVSGSSKDSLLISEYLLGVRETMNPETTTADVRTRIGFGDLGIKEIKSSDKDAFFYDVRDVLDFELTAKVVEKSLPRPDAQEVNVSVSGANTPQGFERAKKL
jgi:hypothetical protein